MRLAQWLSTAQCNGTNSADVEGRFAWIDDRLSFDDERLAGVAAELDRWFDVDVRVASSALLRHRISATYSEPSLTTVLNGLMAALDAHYTRNGRVITIFAKHQ